MKLTIRSIFETIRIPAFLVVLGTSSLNALSSENEAVGTTSDPTAFPGFLVGEWLVTEVHVDRHIDRTGQPDPHGEPYSTFYNDPVYVGRVFRISEHAISWKESGVTGCDSPLTLQVDTYTITELFKRSFRFARSPDDFGLSIPTDGVQMVYRFMCEGRAWHGTILFDKKPDDIDGWILHLPDGKLAVRWDVESILMLERFKPAEHATPSFNCELAKTVSEQAICESPVLALYDLSVDTAYKQLLKTGNAAKIRLLKASQKGWMAKREECQRDKNCLADRMLTRVFDIQRLQGADDLSEQWQDDIFLAPKSRH
jgi:uncharacterized protein YecT (DUF1311 family)